MNRFIVITLMMVVIAGCTQGSTTKWVKYEHNPVFGGGEMGTAFDITMLKEDGLYKMWFSWRPRKSIAYTESSDGIQWSEPVIVLAPLANDWERDLNRPSIVKKNGVYHLWYTGETGNVFKIGYATSSDGINFARQSEQPILAADQPWERTALMSPHVLWDKQEQIFKMWYSGGIGGAAREPDAIGYAISHDGLHWEKYANNPVFVADKNILWEQHKVTGGQIIKRKKDYLMFYIGFKDDHFAQIGMAKSPDGISGWKRYGSNPIISPTKGGWDADACYKPFAIQEKDCWLLWYNGRTQSLERIGMAIYGSNNLGF